MDNAVKITSIRCDMHPPLSAVMFCDACRKFLCRICAEVRAGGRFCVTCKKPCREPIENELPQLIALRQKAQAEIHEARTAQTRAVAQAEQNKLDRDAKLKADFAARKAAFAQQQSAEKSATASSAGDTGMPAFGSGTGSDFTPAPVPQRRPPVEEDPLAILSERSYLNVIDRARVIMLIVAVFTLLFAIFQYFMVADEERMKNNELAAAHDEWIDKTKQDIAKAATKSENRALENELKNDNFGTVGHAVNSTIFFIARVLVGCYFVAGMLLLILRHTSDQSPRGSTVAAFIVYLLLNLLDLAIFGVGNRYIFALRWMALVALYKAMHVGLALHLMRMEKAAEKAARA